MKVMLMTARYFKKNIFLLLLVAAPFASAFASTESYIETLFGKIQKGNTCTVVDDKFINLPLTEWNQVQNLYVNNVITFQLRNDTAVLYPTRAFSCTLNISIKYYSSRDQQTPTEINNIDLVVKYDTAKGSYYPVEAKYRFKNAYKVEITVNSISSPEWGDKLPDIFRVKNQIFLERKYPFKPEEKGSLFLKHASSDPALSNKTNNLAQRPDPSLENNQVIIVWTPFGGSEEYDIEWTYIDALSAKGAVLTNPTPVETIAGWMRFDNTRVTVDGTMTSYSINLPYTDGYILVRVRGASYNAITNLRITSDWEYDAPDALNVTATLIPAHFPNLNWQYNAAFAEQGKRKEVISYFDGTLRNRQSVTINNNNNVHFDDNASSGTDDVAIVAETIYDNMGRPTMNILPAPVHNNPEISLTPGMYGKKLQYYAGINRNGTGNIYGYNDIVNQASNNTCGISVAKLSGADNNFGFAAAGQYYSQLNGFIPADAVEKAKYAHRKYVPDAEGYPFAVTEYTPDNTGRIRRQGGTGEDFQLGSGHETRYLYSKPLQKDLDRLFGVEAGDCSHYLKNTVIDPNGQVSVSYIDAKGRTIATALAGASPENLDALNSKPMEPVTRLDQALMKSADFSRQPADLNMTASATFVPVVTGDFTIKYSVNLAAITTTGVNHPFQFCNNCYYDILVEVRNECGEVIASETTPSFQGVEFTCQGSPTPINRALTFTVGPKIGEYTITYTLQLSDDIINQQVDYYVNNNEDLKTIQDFFKEEFTQADLTGCFKECSSCKEKLFGYNFSKFKEAMLELFDQQAKEKYPQFLSPNVVKFIHNSTDIQNIIQSKFTELKNACMALQISCLPASPCEQKLQMMQYDVMPDGQYLLYNKETFNVLPGESGVNILDNNNGVTQSYKVDPNITDFEFTDANGNIRHIKDADVTQAEFIQAYLLNREAWSKDFVKRHIEYCSYEWCTQNEGSYVFDESLSQVVTSGSDAEDREYYDRSDYAAIMDHDPFFNTTPGSIYKQAMKKDLEKLSSVLRIIPQTVLSDNITHVTLPSKNILQLIDWMLYCRPTDLTSNNWTTCSVENQCRAVDREWEMYRNYYLKLKSKYVRLAKLSQDPSCDNCYIGNDALSASICIEPNYDDFTLHSRAAEAGGDEYFILFKEPLNKPFECNYIVTIEYNNVALGASTTQTVNVIAGKWEAIIPDLTAAGFGNPMIIKIECLPGSFPISSCISVPPSTSIDPCPDITDFSLVSVDNYQIDLPQGMEEVGGKNYLVFNSGAITRPVKIKITLSELDPNGVIHVTYFYVELDAGETSVYVGDWKQVKDKDKGDILSSITFSITEDGIICDNYTPQTYTAVASVCRDHPEAPLYRFKVRVFNEYTNEDQYLDCINGNGNGSVVSGVQSILALKAEAIENLNALKENWITTLKSVIDAEPQFASITDATLNVLIGKLYAVSLKAITLKTDEAIADLPNVDPDRIIRPESSLPSGQTIEGTIGSFKAVFNNVIGPTLMEHGFSEDLLEQPYPYDRSPFIANPVVSEITPELCANVNTIRQLLVDNSDDVGEFDKELRSILTYDYILTKGELQDIIYRCENNCRVLSHPLTVPVAFVRPPVVAGGSGYSPWITCAVFNDLENYFSNTLYPQVEPNSRLYRVLFTNYMNKKLGYSLSYTEYADFKSRCDLNHSGLLFNKAGSVSQMPDPFSCVADIVKQVFTNAGTEYERYIEIVRREFRNVYITKCLQNKAAASITGDQYEYHYTLYYYDQSGNLVKTVPPAGVRLLNNDELDLVDIFREEDNECKDDGEPTTESYSTAFNSMSNALQDNSARAIEMWINSSGTDNTRQVRFITPDNKYMYQAAIKDDYVWVELYSLTPGTDDDIDITLSNSAAASIAASGIALQSWTNIFVQSSTDLLNGQLKIYVDGKLLTNLTGANVPLYPFDWEVSSASGSLHLPDDEIAQLKHLRIYERIASADEIWANYLNPCLGPVYPLSVLSDPQLLWGRFNVPDLCTNALETREVTNAGSLTVSSATDAPANNLLAGVTNNFTVEFWVNPTEAITVIPANMLFNKSTLATYTTGISGQHFAIYPTAGSQSANTAPGVGISVGTNGVNVFEYGEDAVIPGGFSSSIFMPAVLSWSGSMSGWHHVAVVYKRGFGPAPGFDPEIDIELYINGVIKNGTSPGSAHSIPSPAYEYFNHKVSPSYNFEGGSYGYMPGQIDEVRIWGDTWLEQIDILANYNKPVLPNSPNLVGYWPMTPQEGANIIKDISCFGHSVTYNTGSANLITTAAPIKDLMVIEKSNHFIVPNHLMPTNYAYNSLNQVIKQTTPDAGRSDFFYDRLGRLAVSQNAEQLSPADAEDPAERYSYTKYDAIGRIVEVGETIKDPSMEAMDEDIARGVDIFDGTSYLEGWLATGTNRQVTVTAYDKAPDWAPAGLLQSNLRKRVTASGLFPDGGTPSQYTVKTASYYSYDLVGNVDMLVQQDAKLVTNEKTFITASDGLKRIGYEYDLVSGKVNLVKYQEGKWDQFYYKYLYDADNRVITALSGRTNANGGTELTTDAVYQYYLHGPLARTELGKNKVQGLDYAYTLQGWLKGVNGHFLNPASDISSDGSDAINQPYGTVARDVFGFSLGYHHNDYHPVDATATAFGLQFTEPSTGLSGAELFNGNIRNSTYAISHINNGNTAGYTYRYDQLNRITRMDFHNITGNWGNTITSAQDYGERIRYDANGNIETYLRNKAGASPADRQMDQLTYWYFYTDNSGVRHQYDPTAPLPSNAANFTNQLAAVKDVASTPFLTEDIEGQPDENYQYDKIGNLVQDNSTGTDHIDHIKWTVYGKIASIEKTGTTIKYGYDAGGNRVSKTVIQASPSNAVTTHYVRDATGNVMAVYEYSAGAETGTPSSGKWMEQMLYGSSRLGMLRPGLSLSGLAAAYNVPTGDPLDLGEGLRNYELSNHLGNVMAVISDKHTSVTIGNSYYYKADLITANDYYPFGMQMPGRKYDPGMEYRYGFNGKENDNDVKGEGNQQDYGMRIYDTRLGRFLSVDPLTKEYPMLTPYQYASNNPIQNIDIDGLEGRAANGANTNTEATAGPWNFEFLKGKKQSYDNSSWMGWPGSTKQSIFVQNAVTSAWNQGISAVESLPENLNYITSKHSRQENFEMLTNLTMKAVRWWNSEPFQKVETYEDIAGSLLLGEAMGQANPFSRGNSYLKIVSRDKIPVRIANAEEARYLKSMGKQADYNPYGNSENPRGDILLSSNSRIQLIEEAIHYKQTKKYGLKYVEDNVNQLEFDAQFELLRIGRAEGWSKSSMEEIRRAAITWGKKYVSELEGKLQKLQTNKK